MRTLSVISVAIALTACRSDQVTDPQTAFFDALTAHCGKAYAGKLVSSDAVDADFGNQTMIMHIAECTDTQIQIPFAVGDNRSRTWIITRTNDGLRLKHRHAHKDGTLDAVTNYGGDTSDMGTATRQEFPVDQYSIDLFLKEGLDVSITNVWAVEITPEIYAYELSRESRFFRVEFDVTRPVATPPARW